MPELPEVQTIINDLNEKIAGDTITGFWTDWTKTIKNLPADKFEKQIKNKKILRARRIGKNIFIDLSGGKTIYIHLKMTGHLLVKTSPTSPLTPLLSKERGTGKDKNLLLNKEKVSRLAGSDEVEGNYFSERVNQYIHHIWYLTDPKLPTSPAGRRIKYESTNNKYNKTLEFSDLRKFGKIMLVDTEKIGELKEIRELGIDVMDKNFTLEKFQELLNKKKNAPIGVVLMDQSLLSGIGNIYRSEILFEAGISPFKKTKSLKDGEIKKIYQAIGKVLQKAIKLRGTSDSDYRDTSGAPGGFQKVLKVYNRESEKCKKCGEKVKREKLGGRSAFLCDKCQK